MQDTSGVGGLAVREQPRRRGGTRHSSRGQAQQHCYARQHPRVAKSRDHRTVDEAGVNGDGGGDTKRHNLQLHHV